MQCYLLRKGVQERPPGHHCYNQSHFTLFVWLSPFDPSPQRSSSSDPHLPTSRRAGLGVSTLWCRAHIHLPLIPWGRPIIQKGTWSKKGPGKKAHKPSGSLGYALSERESVFTLDQRCWEGPQQPTTKISF